MISDRCQPLEPHLQPLLEGPTHDRAFAAPRGCGASARAMVDTLNGAHHSWQAHKLFTVDTRLTGSPAPLSIVGTARERKSPNRVANRIRRWCNAAPSAQQAQKRSAMRLLRDGLLAAIRYYGLDPHLYYIPTDADILRWPPSKVRAIIYATRDELFVQVMQCELPEAFDECLSTRPQLALHLGIEQNAHAPHLSHEECYIAFTKPRPFWRRFGDSLFCVPIIAVSGAYEGLFAEFAAPPRTFAQRGRIRYERLGPGKFVAM